VGKKVDVAKYVDLLVVGEGADAIEQAGYAGALLPMRMRVLVTPNGSAKAAEVVESLFGAECPARYIRTAMGTLRDGAVVLPTALEALRAIRAEAKAVEDAARAEAKARAEVVVMEVMGEA